MTSRVPARPVRNRRLCTAVIHGRNRVAEPTDAVFPAVHTLYDYYERF